MRKVISLSSILLYLDNPRFSQSTTQHEALCKIVQDQGKKLISLAKDIVEYGMDELDGLAVFPDSKKGFYRVAEGNRRVSALKLIRNPELISKEYPQIAKEFRKMSQQSKINFNHINVVVFESEKDPQLVHFLQIRHLGENGGIGTVEWSATQKARFNYRTSGKESLVIFLDYLENKHFLTRKQIDEVTPTNWQRIFRPVGLKFLKLTKQGESYQILGGCEKEFSVKIQLVADQLRGKTVAIVYGQKEIEKFFKDIEKEYQSEVENNYQNPDTNTYSNDHEKINRTNSNGKSQPDADGFYSNESYNKSSISKKSAELEKKDETHKSDISKKSAELEKKDETYEPLKDKRHSKMPSDPYKNCNTVIPHSIRIQSRNHRINQIISELKSLDVETYPNACGCLLRILIELSAKEYLEHNNKETNYDATSMQFTEAISHTTARMVQCGQLVRAEANAVKKETNDGGVRLLFNGYMHNTETYPSSVVIKGIFQTYLKFLKECLL